jgi:hypothetical protein
MLLVGKPEGKRPLGRRESAINKLVASIDTVIATGSLTFWQET